MVAAPGEGVPRKKPGEYVTCGRPDRSETRGSMRGLPTLTEWPSCDAPRPWPRKTSPAVQPWALSR